MKPRFLADANFNQKIIAGIRRRDPLFDALSAHKGGVWSQSDPEVLNIAAQLGRILLSHDRKTIPAHFAAFLGHSASPGLILVAQTADIGAVIDDLHLIWETTLALEWVNTLLYLPL